MRSREYIVSGSTSSAFVYHPRENEPLVKTGGRGGPVGQKNPIPIGSGERKKSARSGFSLT